MHPECADAGYGENGIVKVDFRDLDDGAVEGFPLGEISKLLKRGVDQCGNDVTWTWLAAPGTLRGVRFDHVFSPTLPNYLTVQVSSKTAVFQHPQSHPHALWTHVVDRCAQLDLPTALILPPQNHSTALAGNPKPIEAKPNALLPQPYPRLLYMSGTKIGKTNARPYETERIAAPEEAANWPNSSIWYAMLAWFTMKLPSVKITTPKSTITQWSVRSADHPYQKRPAGIMIIPGTM